jgi:hypothetical protein
MVVDIFWIGTAILGFCRNSISSGLYFLLHQYILPNFSPYWMVASPLHFMGKFRHHVKWSHRLVELKFKMYKIE